MPCSCPAGELKCPKCPRQASCRYWTPSNGSKFFNCGDRNQWGMCKRPKTECPNCPFYKPPSEFKGRPRVVDEFDRMEADDPFWNDPRAWGSKVDPVESHKGAQKRYTTRKREEDPTYNRNSPEYMREYMREYRKKQKEARKKGGGEDADG